MTNKKARAPRRTATRAEDQPASRPSKLSKKVVQSLNRRLALHTAKYSCPVLVSRASDVTRNYVTRYVLLGELLQHPAVREAATMRQAVDFVRKYFQKEPVVAQDVECVLRYRAKLLSDPLEVQYGTDDGRWWSAARQWEESQSWALERAMSKIPQLAYGPKGNLIPDDDVVTARNALWLYRSRVPRPDGSGKESIRSLANEHRARFLREGQPRPKGDVDRKPVRVGIKNAERLLRLPHRMMS